MGKRIALLDEIMIDGVNMSDFFSSFVPDFQDEDIDVSGFNVTGTDESLSGKRTQTITGQVWGSYGVGEVWDILYPLYRDRATFAIKWRPNGALPVSATNPSLEGNANMRTWGAGATRGAAESFAVVFKAADSAGFEYVTT